MSWVGRRDAPFVRLVRRELSERAAGLRATPPAQGVYETLGLSSKSMRLSGIRAEPPLGPSPAPVATGR